MTRTDSKPGTLVLMVAHCAGMVDLVALPVWVGTLIGYYKLDPQQAGGLATLFLLGAVIASMILAPRFHRLPGRWMATAGFAVASAAFYALSQANDYAVMATLHAVGGFSAGTALSFTHGTIGRSANPHRLFAIVGIALGIFAVLFLGTAPKRVETSGGPMLFQIFGAIMLIAALFCAVAFPVPDDLSDHHESALPRLHSAVWYGVVGVGLMALTQSMMFSFIERIGADRGFGTGAVQGVLLALGIVNLFPALLAGMLQKRLDPHHVLMTGPVLQALIALVVTQSPIFAPYAVATSVFAFVMIFSHTFAFGLLSRLDPSGRAVAATPAMLMVGSAIGPILGGTLVKASGYAALGGAAVAVAAMAVVCFQRARQRPQLDGAPA